LKRPFIKTALYLYPQKPPQKTTLAGIIHKVSPPSPYVTTVIPIKIISYLKLSFFCIFSFFNEYLFESFEKIKISDTGNGL